MDIVQQAGASALGSRFRRIAERLSLQASDVYKHNGLNFEPTWFPVLFALTQYKSASITQLASMTGQSHPFISKIVKQMQLVDLLVSTTSASDKRVNILMLSEQGQALIPKLEQQINDMGNALFQWLDDVAPDLLNALQQFESGLDNTTLLDLVLQY